MYGGVMMKQLLIRGDDLGYSEGVTLGMLSAYEHGIVNSMACMINMPYINEGIVQAKKHKNLCLGLHVNVTNGKALAPKEKIKNLVDENGYFIKSSIRRQQIKNNETLFTEEEAYLEAKYQIERYIELVGEVPEYIDIHVLEIEPLINAVLRIYHEYHVPVCLYDQDLYDRDILKRAMKHYDYYQDHDHDFEKVFTDGFYELKEGINLLVTHPGFIDYDVATTSSMLKPRLYDYSLVTSKKLKKWLDENNIEIISFRDLKKASK